MFNGEKDRVCISAFAFDDPKSAGHGRARPGGPTGTIGLAEDPSGAAPAVAYTHGPQCHLWWMAVSVIQAAASAVRTSAGRDFELVFLMMAARWLSTVRWLMPRSAAMFLLGWPARTRSKIWR